MAINFKLYNINDPLKNKVTFIKNPSEQLKFSILEKALALIYTPDYEHFGIVPVEAMFACVPVITSATGGPLESVIDGVTGFHIENFSIELVEKMKYFIKNPEKRDEMGHAGHAHCLEKFSTASLDKHLCRLITDLKENKLIK
uniref:Alpha-1,3/1,6-mannosyltransferase ALG2 (Trinotate prediction) n=1 Tax=Henneguya salminicola TaxID=69463 RepID=A0A6G3ML30_HENSL